MAYRQTPEPSHTALPRPPPPRPPRPNYSNYSPPSLVIPPSPSPNKSQSTPLPTSRTRKQPLPPHPTVRTSPPSIAAVLSASPTTSPTSSSRLPPRSRRMSASFSPTTSTPVSPVGSVGSAGSLLSPRPSPSKSKRHPDNIIAHPRVNQRFRYFPKVAIPGILTQPPSRMVGFAENGDVKGVPAIVIGGHGCSRLVGVMFDELGKRYGVRMIWPERPGYGLSEDCRCEEMKVLEWADAIAQLADHLHIRRFALIGQSVGAVFALAVAHKYPTRVLGPIYLISPWVSTYVTNTFRWTRRLPASLFVGALNLAMDVMWSFDKLSSFSMDGWFGAGAAAAIKEASRSSEEERGSWDRLTHSRKGSNSSLGSSSTSGSARVRRDHDRSPLSADAGYASGSGSGSDRDTDDEDAVLGPSFVEIPTDFPEDRPLKHVVRARTVQLYFTMNNRRAIEPSTQGQLCDVVVALEKYQRFGFSFADVRCPVTVLWGDKDTLIPQSAVEWMANNMRDVKIKVLEGEDHTLIWKEGVVEWAIRGIGEKYQKGRARQQAVPRVEVQVEIEAGEEYEGQVEFGMAL